MRRGSLVAALVVAGLLLVDQPPAPSADCPDAPASVDPAPATGARQPNIVVLLTDDQRWDTLEAMPNVRDLLGAHGVTFTNAFATTPLCCPSRASILTGQASRHTGVYDNVAPGGGASAFEDTSTIATWLDDAGYRTALIGKYLNGYPELGRCHIPPGWDEWSAIFGGAAEHYYDLTLDVNGRLVRYGDSPRDYQTDVLFRRATRFVGSARPPFFLYLAPSAPHLPAIAAPPDLGAYQGLRPWRPPSYAEADRDDKPWHDAVLPWTRAWADWTDAARRSMLESLRSLDRWIGRLVGSLERAGELGRTIFVFTSDNGYLWGEHGLRSKAWPYDEAIRIPLVIRGPWIDEPRTDPSLVANIDLAATIAELAGVTPELPQDGRSLVPLLRDERPRWRRDLVIEWLGRDLTSTGRGPAPYSALRSRRYMYIEYADGGKELYDLLADPFQLENVADRADHAGLVARLHLRLMQLIRS